MTLFRFLTPDIVAVRQRTIAQTRLDLFQAQMNQEQWQAWAGMLEKRLARLLQELDRAGEELSL